LVKLESALDNELISDQVLSILALQIQKGVIITDKAISRICNMFLTSKSESLKEELLFTINSIVRDKLFDRNLIKKVLIHGVE